MSAGRRWAFRAAAAYVVIVVAVIVGLGGLYRAASSRLDRAMGDRLLGVARGLAAGADAPRLFAVTVGDSGAVGAVDSLARRCEDVRRLEDLAEITLSDPDGRVLFSTSAHLRPGSRNDFWDLDRPAVEAARHGFGHPTRLYRLQDTFLKSAHAPVLLADPGFGDPLVVGILTVSGSPDFFGSLGQLRRGAFVTGGLILLVLVLMGAFLVRIQRSLESYRNSLRRQENLAVMGRMTAGIAHEIRNPLGIIKGAGEHLQRVLTDAGVQDPMADFIPEEVDRLDHILDGYLAFGTDREVPGEVFDVAGELRRGLRLGEAEREAAAIDLVLREPLPTVRVFGDPRRFQQVVLNLLLNARDAMPDGGELAVSLAVSDGRAVLVIADCGSGLPAVDAERLFDPFWTSKEKGSGLGLALSRGIVAAMGGELKLANRPDGPGAAATVTLPLHRET